MHFLRLLWLVACLISLLSLSHFTQGIPAPESTSNLPAEAQPSSLDVGTLDIVELDTLERGGEPEGNEEAADEEICRDPTDLIVPPGFREKTLDEADRIFRQIKHILGSIEPSKGARITAAMSFTTAYFLIELIIGYVTQSLTLQADAFHMLSDLLAFIIGFFANNLQSRPSSQKFNFGYLRASLLAANDNTMMLIALSTSVLFQAISRMFQEHEVTDPKLVVITGCCGLAVNVGQMLVLGGHGHSHSHGPGGHDHDHSHDDHSHDDDHEHDHHHSGHSDEEIAVAPSHSHEDMNMKGMLLHVMGDLLGSVGVIVAGLIEWLSDWSHKNKVDPVMSMVISLIILYVSVPVKKATTLALLDAVPAHIDHAEVKRTIEEFLEVVRCERLRIRGLSENVAVADMIIRVNTGMEVGSDEEKQLSQNIQDALHRLGIQSATIQLQRSEHHVPVFHRLNEIMYPGGEDFEPVDESHSH